MNINVLPGIGLQGEGGFDFLFALLPYLIIIVIGAIIIRMVIQPFAPLLGIFMRRQKPIQQKREDYDMLFIADQKRGAKSNQIPARKLYCRDPYDPEQPRIYWGKIMGCNAESDVIHLLVKKRVVGFSKMLFVPREKVSDLHSKQLYVESSGFRPVSRLYWMPIWGSRMAMEERERLRLIVQGHLDALHDEFGYAVYREERLAQTVKAMEPALSSGRLAPSIREPTTVAVRREEGIEEIE